MALGPVRLGADRRSSPRSPGSACSGTTGRPRPAPHGISLGAVARTRLGWGMALFFGFQSLQAYSVFGWFAQVYRDAGFAAGTAGLLLGVITGDEHPAVVLAAGAGPRGWSTRPG